jgi:hypothetical protein
MKYLRKRAVSYPRPHSLFLSRSSWQTRRGQSALTVLSQRQSGTSATIRARCGATAVGPRDFNAAAARSHLWCQSHIADAQRHSIVGHVGMQRANKSHGHRRKKRRLTFATMRIIQSMKKGFSAPDPCSLITMDNKVVSVFWSRPISPEGALLWNIQKR